MNIGCLKMVDYLIKSSFYRDSWLCASFSIEIDSVEAGQACNERALFSLDNYCLAKLAANAESIKWGFEDSAFSFNLESGICPNLIYLSTDVYSLNMYASLLDRCCFDLVYKLQKGVGGLKSKESLFLFFIRLYEIYRKEVEALSSTGVLLLSDSIKERSYYLVLVLVFISVLFFGSIDKNLLAIATDFFNNEVEGGVLESRYSGWAEKYFDFNAELSCELDMWFELFGGLEFHSRTDFEFVMEFLLS